MRAHRLSLKTRIAFAFGIAWLALVVIIGVVRAGDQHEYAPGMVPPTAEEEIDIQRWIPATCCRTNKCCFKVAPTAIHPLSRDEYQVVATGQTVKRTGWSEDGQTWRCACDLQPNGGWKVHLKANTRCVFPAPAGY